MAREATKLAKERTEEAARKEKEEQKNANVAAKKKAHNEGIETTISLRDPLTIKKHPMTT